MDCETRLWLVALFVFSATYMQRCVIGDSQVPGFFIFGDSLSDCGNNNNLNTDAKVNHLPYGIDFPLGPTGRFTNGRTGVDILTELLGFEQYIPPFANTSGSDILKGVNYASGSSGILKETGKHLGDHIDLGKQLQNHKVIVSQIHKKLGRTEKAKKHLKNCLYYVNIGSNDYINNYFLPEHYDSSHTFSPEQFAEVLIKIYSTNLKALHALGARKIALVGVGPVGCAPHEISIHGKPGSLCVEEENDAGNRLNEKLKALVDSFNEEFPDAKFIFIANSLESNKNEKNLQAADVSGIVVCCKVGKNGQCIPNEEPCKRRNQHPFFDAFHPTEMVNQVMAANAYNASTTNMAHPMDISHLVKL